MLLSIKLLSSNDSIPTHLSVPVEPTDSITQLKVQLAAQLSTDPAKIQISLFKDQYEMLLSDDLSVGDYSLDESSKLLLTILREDITVELALRDQIKARKELVDQQEAASAKDWLQLLIDQINSGQLSEMLQLLGVHTTEMGLPEDDEDELVSAADSKGWTALHYASYTGHANIVQALITKHANCNKESLDQWTPLQLACHFGFINCVKALFRHPRLQVDRMTESRGTALHVAAKRGHANVVVFLLDNEACMTISDQTGCIPLQVAANQEIMELIPRYMGEKELKKLRALETVEIGSFGVEVMYTGSLVLYDKELYLFLDPQHGVLSIFENRAASGAHAEPMNQVRLIEITDITRSKGLQYGSSEAFCFVLFTTRGNFKFYTMECSLTDEIIGRLDLGIHYAHERKIGIALMPTQELVPTADEDQMLLMDRKENMTLRLQGDEEVISFKSFTTMQELGSGSFGKVYKVIKNNTKQVFALKSLNKAFLLKHKQLKYAIGECKILRMMRHPFIIPMDYAFQTPKNLYMVLEYCPNGDLMTHLSERCRFAESAARFYIAEIVLAIEYLHSLDIVYRDLKPENILLDRVGHVRLADFGLAKENVNPLNPAMSFCGSPAYLAPELLSKAGSEKSADIYGIGAMLYELLTGMPPYYSDNIKELFRNIRKGFLQFPKTVRTDAQEILRKILDKDPRKRPKIGQMKAFAFFKDIDWELLEQKRVRPPRLGVKWVQMDEYNEEEYAELPEGPGNILKDEDYGEENEYEDAVAEFNFSKK